MEVIDISMRLYGGTPLYEGDPEFSLRKVKTIHSDDYMLSEISMGLHTGTHVDAPAHFIKGGKTLDQMGLESLMGKARVLDFTQIEDQIKEYDLMSFNPRLGEILLFKTRNSSLLEQEGFSRDFVSLGDAGAKYLAKCNIKAVGIDYLSIEAFDSPDNKVHKTLLENGIPIIEGIDLRGVEPGEYGFMCLPLRIAGGEAAPARCILLKGVCDVF